jgi:hypothetical protein
MKTALVREAAKQSQHEGLDGFDPSPLKPKMAHINFS